MLVFDILFVWEYFRGHGGVRDDYYMTISSSVASKENIPLLWKLLLPYICRSEKVISSIYAQWRHGCADQEAKHDDRPTIGSAIFRRSKIS